MEHVMMAVLKKLFNDETGSECIEMALVTASVSICSIASFQSIKSGLNESMDYIASNMNSVFDQ